VAKAEPLVIKLIIEGEKKLKPTEARLNKIKDLVNSIDKVSSNLFDGRSVKGGVKALTELKEKLGEAAAGNKKFAENFSGLNRQLGKFQTIVKEAKIETQQFTDAIVAAERVQQKLFSARGAQSQALAKSYGGKLGADLIPNLMGQMDSSEFIKSRDSLSNYRAELTRVFDAVEIGSKNYQDLEAQIRKVDGLLGRLPKANKITGVGSGLAGKEQALKEALRLQNQLETGSDAHIKSIVGTRKAQQAYNQELRVSKTIQSALNLDLIVWKKLLDSVPAIMGKIAGGMKGLFMGKFGKLGQATGIITVSKAVQELIKIIPFLDQRLKNNIQQWALLTQRAVEGITGITIAWTALNGLLGGAQWVVGAVAGFAQFESAASKAIWTIEGQMTRAFSTFGRFARELPSMASALAMVMPESLGGMGVKGSFFDYLGDDKGGRDKLKETMLGGEERIEDKRYRKKGEKTQLQAAQQELNTVNKLLAQRNTTEEDYIELLQRRFGLERKLKRERRKQQVMEVKAGKPFEEVFSTEIEAADKRRKERLRAYNKEREASIKRGTKLIQDADARIAQAGKDKLKEVQNRWKLEATNHSKELKRIKERQTAERQRTANRKKAMSRFGENVMLGAGFPMLFGGGPGAVAGGLTGAVGQSLMGSSGFGMQILFSALGQQVDAFVGKAAELGKALNKINPDVDAVIGSLGEVNTEYGKHLEMLKKIKGDAAAMAEATRRLTEIIGQGGVAAMEKFGDDTTRLGNEWTKMTTLMMASISELINSSGILLTLTQAISKANRFNIFERRVDDIKAGGKSFGDLSQNEKDIMDLAGLRKGILENQGGDKFKQWIRENVVELTNVVPDGIGGKSLEGFLSRSSGQREALTNIDNQIDTLMRKILAEESIGDLLGSGAGKAAALQEEIHLLEQSFKLGSKKAQIEQEVAEYYKDQGKNVKDMLPAEVENVRQQFKRRDALKEQLEVWNQIKETIASGLTNAIMGLVEGTKSLKEALAGILKQIAQIILQKAILSVIDKTFTFGSGGVAPGGTSLPTDVGSLSTKDAFSGTAYFSSGGMVTRPTVGVIGEAGEDEYIIPASKMASSMQRYSAGARGESVIPGTGSSYGGGGAGGSTTVNYSGPILNFNSEEFIPKSAVGQIIASASARGASIGENRTLSTLKNSRSRRSALGL